MKTIITTLLASILFFTLLPASLLHAEALLHSRTLLLNHDFSALEKRLSANNDAYLAGKISTQDYYAVTQTLWLDRDFDTLDIIDSLILWEKTAPSAYAYAAIAKYHASVGYHERGGNWASETSEEQFTKMRQAFNRSIDYLKKSKQHNIHILSNYLTMATLSKFSPKNFKYTPKINESYLYRLYTLLPTPLQIAIYYFFPDIFTPPTNTREAVYQHPFFSNAPNSIWQQPAIWNNILINATPRWGGSYKEMTIIINNDIPKHIGHLNEQQQSFYQSYIVEDKISTLYTNKEYKKAYKMARKFITKHDSAIGVNEQAMYLAHKLKDHKNCHRYAEKIALQRPWRYKYWYYVGHCAFKLQRWESMNQAFKHRILLKGENKYDIFRLGVSYMYLHRYDKAYPLFLKSKAIDPEYKKNTDQYTNYIEKEKPESMRFKNKSIKELIGIIHYTPNPE